MKARAEVYISAATIDIALQSGAWAQTLKQLYIGQAVWNCALRWLIVLSSGFSLAVGIFAQSLTWLGTLSGYSGSQAFSVSANGAVVVGESSGGGLRAFRWTRLTGMYDLGTLGGSWAVARDTSSDGSVVVGSSLRVAGSSRGERAFRWRLGVGMQDLGTLGGDSSWAAGVSANGWVVVGASTTQGGYSRAFRWTPQTGMVDLGTLGGNESRAIEVSADGNVVVGGAQDYDGVERAFRWTEATGMQDLGSLGGGYSIAYGISPDGTVVVGEAYNSLFYHRPFRWTETDGMQELDGLAIDEVGTAYDASNGGSIVVGYVRPANVNVWAGGRAFRWTEARGLEDLNRVYSQLLSPGSRLIIAYAITPDGRYIAGTGYNAATGRFEGFLLDTRITGDIDGSGCVDDADLLRVLFVFGRTGSRVEDVNGDGMVDDADLLLVLFNFGNGC